MPTGFAVVAGHVGKSHVDVRSSEWVVLSGLLLRRVHKALHSAESSLDSTYIETG